MEVVEVDAQMGGKTVLKKAVPLAQIGESGRTAFFSKADSVGREIALLRDTDGRTTDTKEDLRRPAHPRWMPRNDER